MKIILIINGQEAQHFEQASVVQWCRESSIPQLMMLFQEDREPSAADTGPEIISKYDYPTPTVAVVQGTVCLFPKDRLAYVDGMKVELTLKEYDLLLYLVSRANRILSKEQLYRQIWGCQSGENVSTVIAHVNRLRKKIEPDPARPNRILTVQGQGYRFDAGCSIAPNL